MNKENIHPIISVICTAHSPDKLRLLLGQGLKAVNNKGLKAELIGLGGRLISGKG